ncbi:hypothetical protein JCM10449v2_004649 [Rhodotorula kratochvilovae]
MAAQHASHPPPPQTAKPLAAHPVFPLSPLELQRWNRFAKKGGIGQARARVDKVSEDAVRDLMFLEGDGIVILMDLGASTYLGFCEGVVGLFNGAEVVMQQAKLKRPVISSRSSSTPAPAKPASSSAAPPPHPSTTTRTQTAAQLAAAAPPKPLPRMSSSDSLASSSGRGTPRSRRKPVPEVEVLDERFGAVDAPLRPAALELRPRRKGDGAGLGIAVESGKAASPSARGGTVRGGNAGHGEVQEVLATTQSPQLPGAFASPSLPTSSSAASFPRPRCAVASPAPSSTSTATTRTPSLLTSPYSDFADRDRDDESASSLSGHGHMPYTPEHGAGAWDPSVVHHGAGAELLHAAGLAAEGSKDPRDGPTRTTESFPLHTFPAVPAGAGLPFGELSMSEGAHAPTPFSLPEVQLRGAVSPGQAPEGREERLRRPSHVLSTSGVPVPLGSPHLQSAFSFSPNSSIASTLPPSILSATDLQHRRDERRAHSSDSTIGSAASSAGGHVPGTPTDDPTLAFIFDSYRYSVVAPVSPPASEAFPARTSRSGPLEELVEPDLLLEDDEADAVPALRAFGAASHLRSRLASAPTPPSAPPQGARHAALASTSSLDDVRIPRMSEIFPRSGTHDSLASWSSGTSASARGDATARYAMWAPPTPTKDWSPRRDGAAEEGEEQERPVPSPRRQSEPEMRSQTGEEEQDTERTPLRIDRQYAVPVLDAALLEPDLAASRRLFRAHFSPPQELVEAAAQRQGRHISVDASPSSARHDPPGRLRRKSVKGLLISGPAVPGLMSPPLWRSPDDASPVEQALPRLEDVFVASPVSMRAMPHVEVSGASPSAARTYAPPRSPQEHPSPSALSPTSPYPDSASSPTASSLQTFASASSSPATPSFDEHAPVEAPRRAGSGSTAPKKLRKALHRAKSTPSLGRQHDGASSASVSSGGCGAPPPPMPARQASDPFVVRPARAPEQPTASLASSKESAERKVDYSAGISHKDFEEETVQIGRSEFEMVKPYVALLAQSSEGGHDGEDGDPPHTSFDASRPSASSFRPDELVTPRRPAPPPHSVTNASQFSHATSSATADFARSTVSLSHFSPPTPASVEDGGRSALDDYRNKEAKWLAALGSMTPTQVRKSKKMRALVQAGVPSSVRGKVWAFLAEAGEEKRPGVYQALSALDDAPLSLAVEQDLAATLDHPQFAEGSAGRADIFHVLQAFARFDSKLGYYPGLGSVVGLLLTQMPAEDAFWTLVSLVKNYALRQFFSSAEGELRLETLAFEYLHEAMEPKLAKRMRELGVSPSDYLANWNSSLFLTILPQPTVLRLVDLLLFDPKTRYRVPLALLDLSHLDDRLSFPSRDAVLNHLLAPPPTAFTPALLIPAVATMKLSDDKLKKAHTKAAKALKA